MHSLPYHFKQHKKHKPEKMKLFNYPGWGGGKEKRKNDTSIKENMSISEYNLTLLDTVVHQCCHILLQPNFSPLKYFQEVQWVEHIQQKQWSWCLWDTLGHVPPKKQKS